MLESIKEELHWLHLELPKAESRHVDERQYQRATRSQDSSSSAVRASATKTCAPSTWSSWTSEGDVVEGALKPSSDTASHLYIYRQQPTSTASSTHALRYATAFAANGMSIPVYLTAQADEFSRPIPVAALRSSAARIRQGRHQGHRFVACGSAQEPRRLHRCAQRQSCAQGGGDGRRCGGDRLARPANQPA